MTHPGTITAAASAPQSDRFVWRAEIADTVKLAWPMALTQLGQIAMMTTDLALIGRLGDAAVASVGLAHLILFIGFVFGMGVAIGMLVGCVIVYQILFSDISRHIGEYATLKAMGYANSYLMRVVMGEALILAVLGFIPGWLLALGLYRLASIKIYIPLTMDLSKSALVFTLIFVMCVLSGLLAIRKLRDANPADMF